MWWRRTKLDITATALIDSLKIQNQYLRDTLTHERDRVNRLTEALSRKAGVDLLMPIETPSPSPQPPLRNPWKDPNPVTSVFGPSNKGEYSENKSKS